MKIIPQFNLQNHNTLKLHCVADVFIEIEALQDLLEVFTMLQYQDLPFYVLGEGSNIILKNARLPARVLHLAMSKFNDKNKENNFDKKNNFDDENNSDKTNINNNINNNSFFKLSDVELENIKNIKNINLNLDFDVSNNINININKLIKEKFNQHQFVYVNGDINWHQWVCHSIENGFGYGLENLALIPGTVAASLVQNIGAYGAEVGEHVLFCVVFNTQKLVFEIITHSDCLFAYRDSIFKKAENAQKYIIVGVCFALSKTFQARLNYPDIQNYLKKNYINLNISAKNILQAVIDIRQSKLPNPKTLANVGSFFKNPIVKRDVYLQIVNARQIEESENFTKVPCFEIDEAHCKIPAAWLIEQVGFKAHTGEKGVGIYEKHALVLVNYHALYGADILEFAKIVQDAVFKKFAIRLEIEPQII